MTWERVHYGVYDEGNKNCYDYDAEKEECI